MPSSVQTTRRRPERRRPLVAAVRDRLVRRGLAPHVAVRYARQLQAHWEDVRDELLASGTPCSGAEAEADRRLGTADELVAAAVRVHRAESFGGRHPVLAFALLPFLLVPLLPVLVTLVVVLPFSKPAEDGADAAAVAVDALASKADVRDILRAYWSLRAMTIALPAAAAAYFYRCARRRTLSVGWAWAAAAAVALSGALQDVRLALPRGNGRLSLLVGYGGWPDPGPLCVAIAAAGVVAWLTRRRRDPVDPSPVAAR